MPPRYPQDKRDKVLNREFVVQLRQTCHQYPGLYADVVHHLLGALLEAERHIRALEAENAALWRALHDERTRGQ